MCNCLSAFSFAVSAKLLAKVIFFFHYLLKGM